VGLAAVGLTAILSVPGILDAQSNQGLTAGAQVARIYDAILDARPADVASAMKEGCATTPAAASRGGLVPAEACQVLDVVHRWWQMQQDALDTSADAGFSSRADAAIAAGEAWVAREPGRAEAWFYLGAGYGARAQWRTSRGQSLAAARDGKRIKQSLEQAVALDPALHDARFGIGLYQYYADIAPTAGKLVRWMLLLPGGDRRLGLRAMEQARARAQVLRSEADYQLHLIYLWYEHRPEDALKLVQALSARHPHNPRFLEIEAELHDVHRSDPGSSLRAWRALKRAADAGAVANPVATSAIAGLGAARLADHLGDTDVAIEELRALLSPASAPVGFKARVHLALGVALDRMGARTEAASHLRQALQHLPPGDPLHTGAMARSALRRPTDVERASAYRASLEGWRAVERGAWPEAERLLARATRLQPTEPTTRYRVGRLRVAEGRGHEGVEILESVISDRRTPPRTYADACFAAAVALEQTGDLQRAAELYRLVVDAFGAEPDMKAAARRALTRMAA
jgi:tetratricopeptide (TPR) repeat protein